MGVLNEKRCKEIDILHRDTEGDYYTILMNYNFEIKPNKKIYEHKQMDYNRE